MKYNWLEKMEEKLSTLGTPGIFYQVWDPVQGPIINYAARGMSLLETSSFIPFLGSVLSYFLLGIFLYYG